MSKHLFKFLSLLTSITFLPLSSIGCASNNDEDDQNEGVDYEVVVKYNALSSETTTIKYNTKTGFDSYNQTREGYEFAGFEYNGATYEPYGSDYTAGTVSLGELVVENEGLEVAAMRDCLYSNFNRTTGMYIERSDSALLNLYYFNGTDYEKIETTTDNIIYFEDIAADYYAQLETNFFNYFFGDINPESLYYFDSNTNNYLQAELLEVRIHDPNKQSNWISIYDSNNDIYGFSFKEVIDLGNENYDLLVAEDETNLTVNYIFDVNIEDDQNEGANYEVVVKYNALSSETTTIKYNTKTGFESYNQTREGYEFVGFEYNGVTYKPYSTDYVSLGELVVENEGLEVTAVWSCTYPNFLWTLSLTYYRSDGAQLGLYYFDGTNYQRVGIRSYQRIYFRDIATYYSAQLESNIFNYFFTGIDPSSLYYFDSDNNVYLQVELYDVWLHNPNNSTNYISIYNSNENIFDFDFKEVIDLGNERYNLLDANDGTELIVSYQFTIV